MPPINTDLDTLLTRFDKPVAKLARKVIATVRGIRPELVPKVQFGWGSVNFRHPAAGFLCAVFPSADHVSLIFEHGRLLDSPLLVGDGKTKQVRWIPFKPGDEIPVDDIAILLAEAVALRA